MIDIEKPVKLLRLQCVQGNLYHPRIYQPGELPPELVQEGMVTQDFTISTPAPPIAVAAVQVVEVSLKSAEPNVLPAPYPTASQIDSIEKIAINRATVDEISRLPGVGTPAAVKIASLREEKLFADVEDLNSRVPLKKGDWSAIAGRILF